MNTRTAGSPANEVGRPVQQPVCCAVDHMDKANAELHETIGMLEQRLSAVLARPADRVRRLVDG